MTMMRMTRMRTSDSDNNYDDEDDDNNDDNNVDAGQIRGTRTRDENDDGQ